MTGIFPTVAGIVVRRSGVHTPLLHSEFATRMQNARIPIGRAAPAAQVDTQRLSLRVWSPNDAAALASALDASRIELARWTPWVLEESESVESLRRKLGRFADHFVAGVEWRYAVALRNEPSRPIGECGLYPRVGPNALELGYWMATTATGRGYATEAAGALGDVAFGLLHIDRVEIRCEPTNMASMRVPQRLGYMARPAIVHERAELGRPGGDVIVWERHRPEPHDG